MRKLIFLMTLLMGLLLCASAQAAPFTYDTFAAEFEISDTKYTIIRPGTLEQHEDLLARRGQTAEEAQADWEERGVLLQAWTTAGDACLEISAVQDEFAAQYYDVNQVSEEERKTYRLGHSTDKNGYYRALGYDYTDATWKNTSDTGRFLQLEYTRTVNGETWRGYARKTIRNGYSIHLDYQVFGRALKSSDKNALNDVMDTWEFNEVWPRPAASVSKLIFSKEPPAETSTGKFTIEGSGSTGLRIIGVVLRMSASDAQQFETTIGKSGKFEMDVKLPQEGYWMMTYTVENAGTVVEEGAFNPITYQKNLLTVAMDSELPITLTGDSLTISGTTMKQTKVQCIVDGRYDKQITTNNSGKYSFKIDTSEEGAYTITLVFEKKGYATRRFRAEASRAYTEEDRRQKIRDEAVKPAYKTLTSKINGYTGRYMVYTLNVKSVEQTTTGYLSFAGMSKTKKGVYKELVVIRSSEHPGFYEGDQARMYLKCIGTYEVTSDDGTVAYPYFDLQFLE